MDEDAVFVELLDRLAKEQLWGIIRNDGRLVHRGSPGIRAHIIAMVSRARWVGLWLWVWLMGR
jgi:hypothetical protein